MKARFAFGLLPLLAACGRSQSVLHPAGEEAARIHLLSLTLFAGAAIILLLVALAAWLAIRGPDGARAALRAPRMVALAGIAVPVVTLTALLTYGLGVMAKSGASDRTPAVRIVVTAEQWWWRVSYARADGAAVASANEIRIPAGQTVELELHSGDVIHSFWVPALAGKLDMIPGRTHRLRLSAERPGIYRGQCAEYCGGAHAWMAFEVIAMPEAEFAAWLAAAAKPAPADAGRGAALFQAAGCGACHRIAGTPATGTIGPDLTRVGARRFIGAAMLPQTPESLSRFIADAQHFKPGAGMPPFGFLADADLAALSAYLSGLR